MKSRTTKEVVVPVANDPIRRIIRLLEPSHAVQIIREKIGGPKKRRLDFFRALRAIDIKNNRRPYLVDTPEYWDGWVDEKAVYRVIDGNVPAKTPFPLRRHVERERSTGCEIHAHLDVAHDMADELVVLLHVDKGSDGRIRLTRDQVITLMKELTAVTTVIDTHKYNWYTQDVEAVTEQSVSEEGEK